MTKKILTVMSLFLIVFGFTTFAHALPFQNGSFEDYIGPPLPPNFTYTRLGSGSTFITGWTVYTGDIDYIGTTWTPSDGSRSIDLSGSVGSAGGIRQEFDTILGVQYLVRFDMAGNPAGDPTTKSLEAFIEGSSVGTFEFSTAGKTLSNMCWEEKSFTFTALDGLTRLDFLSLINTGYGPAIDNVRVVRVDPVPEPATMLLLGSGLIGIGVFARKRFRK